MREKDLEIHALDTYMKAFRVTLGTPSKNRTEKNIK